MKPRLAILYDSLRYAEKRNEVARVWVHYFGVQADQYSSNIDALVELPNGELTTVSPERLQFVTPYENENTDN